ncbi:proton-translocating NADH-quinone oxidoreductase subunit M [Spiribacter salinus M19-40]|jgi:NADH-quinone oxidoreductase subunit M|uniref:NADH-quinone oxidoreductase subunit M n=1 Tax=Spiribacter salinus M19-40 TaxID=1260251 RepID=R4V6W0_9GAMM|nr:NADH-quinone oxidoreductase subunit M [Spiribacter salinus]AGM40725.1 proton-translocating NADH-quinone oxidoreductase subunit M [Spiribacter salinus M19-40]
MVGQWPLLSLLIWVPILGGIGVLAAGNDNADRARWTALAVAVVTLGIGLALWLGFESGIAGMQFVEKAAWIRAFDIHYHLGVDGISMPLVVLTAFSTLLVIGAAWEVVRYKPAQYLAAFLIMEGIMIGVFSALDAILFYVFFEAMLIPMFLIIGIWGGPNRIYATIKFFLYTFLGSVMMLIALIYLRTQAGSFAIEDFYGLQLPLATQTLIFLAFLAAFAVKVPMFPVHTWLPDAHVEAPTGGSVILAAITLKIGGYGFLRFSLPIAPEASLALDWLLIGLSLIAVVYIGLVAMVQEDLKKLIAYSSIAHMGFVTLGFFLIFRIVANTDRPDGALLALEGGMVQMISHGFVSAAMFLCVGVLYDRMHTRRIADYGGVANRMPVFAGFFVLFAMANAGLPGTSGFVGEFMVILASFQAGFWYAAIAGLTLILGAAYSLWMIKRVVYGEVRNEAVGELKDISAREKLLLGSLAVVILFFGIYPAPLIDVMTPSLDALLRVVMPTL